jgi:trigger factor
MPEADDEFAQLASEFDTLDELTDDLRNRLSRAKRMLQAAQARDRVLEALVDAVDAPLPPAVVDAEIEVRTHDALHSFDHDQKAFDDWLTEQGKTRKEFDDESREAAERSVKSQMVLDAVADAGDIRLTDQELTERVIAQAQRAGVPPDKFIAQAQADGQLGVIYSDARRTKALFRVLRSATVLDSAGEAVDLTDVIGPEQEPADESDPAPDGEAPGGAPDADRS